MAKVTGPLMSLDASGTVGKTATFSKWKGRNYVRLRVTPMNRQTSNQQDARIYLGGAGHALSFALKPVGVTAGSAFYNKALAAAPAGQSWISFAMRSIIGSGASTIVGNLATYTGLSSGVKTVYGAAADTIGITDFSIAVVGSVTSIAKGALVYLLVKFYKDFAGGDTPDDPDTVSTGDLDDFVTALTVAA